MVGEKDHNRRYIVVALISLILIVAIVAVVFGRPSTTEVFEPIDAPPISTTDIDGEPFNLFNNSGNVTILHFTGIEEPVCLECENQMREQIEELQDLFSTGSNATIVTVNMRKNPHSSDGRTLAERWWGLQVGWTWIEDWSPFPVSGPYEEYWNYRGAVSNPSVLLIDGDMRIVAVYHVYQMGSGEVDGVQTAEDLARDIERIQTGEWEGFKGVVTSSGVTVGAMFALGIITSLTPCSIALMAVVISYIMSERRRRSNGEPEEDTRIASRDGLVIGVSFTLGMAIIFFFIGVFLSQIGELVSASTWFYLLAGILVIILGVNSLYPLSFLVPSHPASPSEKVTDKDPSPGFLERSISRLSGDNRRGPIVGFSLGVLFSLAWAPCAVSLILPVFIWLVAQGFSWIVSGGLMFIFGLGHGVPVILLAVAGRSARGVMAQRSARIGEWVTRVFAVLVILFGVILMLRYFGIKLW